MFFFFFSCWRGETTPPDPNLCVEAPLDDRKTGEISPRSSKLLALPLKPARGVESTRRPVSKDQLPGPSICAQGSGVGRFSRNYLSHP